MSVLCDDEVVELHDLKTGIVYYFYFFFLSKIIFLAFEIELQTRLFKRSVLILMLVFYKIPQHNDAVVISPTNLGQKD